MEKITISIQTRKWMEEIGAGELAAAWLAQDTALMVVYAARASERVQILLAIQLGLLENTTTEVATFLEYSPQRRGVTIAEALFQKTLLASQQQQPTNQEKTMFTNDEKLWIKTEFQRQTEVFLEHLRLDHTTSMVAAATRLESILAAINKIVAGKSELRRVVFQRPVLGDDPLRGSLLDSEGTIPK